MIARIISEEHISPGNMHKHYIINIYGGTEEVFSAQPDTLSYVTCFCCHTGQAVTLLSVGQLVFMSVMISENSHSSPIHLNFMFTEDKLEMTTNAIRKLLENYEFTFFMQTFPLSQTEQIVTASGLQDVCNKCQGLYFYKKAAITPKY